MQPLVSIIIPVYNCEKYLSRCLDSLIGQTYKNIEILLVNDGSKDRSLEFASAYAQKDKRIYVFDQENTGVSSARNLGLEHVSGDYFCFVDADDYVSKIYVETLLNNAIDGEFDLSICGFCNSSSSKADFDISTKKPLSNYSAEETLIESYVTRKIGVCVWGKLYRTDAVRGLKFDIRLRLGEDQVFYVDALKRVESVVYQDAKLYCYYEREESAMRATFDERFMDCIPVGEHFSKSRNDFSKNLSALFDKMEIFSYIPSYSMAAKSNNLEAKKIMKLLLPRIRASKTSNVLKYCNRKDAIRYCMIKFCPILTNYLFRIKAKRTKS